MIELLNNTPSISLYEATGLLSETGEKSRVLLLLFENEDECKLIVNGDANQIGKLVDIVKIYMKSMQFKNIRNWKNGDLGLWVRTVAKKE